MTTDSTAQAVLRAALAAQVAELRRRDPLVRQDVEDAVHGMRVATRRLRSVLASFRPLLDPEQSEPLRDELRWIAHVLGEARDATVMRRRLARLILEQPVELMMGPVAQRIDDELSSRYRAAHDAVLTAMHSERYSALLDALGRLATDPPWAEDASAAREDALLARVRKERRRLRARMAEAAAAPEGPERDERLHELRKAARRARYAAEALEPVSGAPARRFAKAMQRVQSVLGDQHDTVAARGLLRELGVQAHLDGDNAFGYGVLHAREQAEGARLEARSEQVRERATRKRLRRWLRA